MIVCGTGIAEMGNGGGLALVLFGSDRSMDPCQPVLPKSAHDSLSAHARAISAGIVDASGALDAAADSGEWLFPEFPSCHRHRAEAY